MVIIFSNGAEFLFGSLFCVNPSPVNFYFDRYSLGLVSNPVNNDPVNKYINNALTKKM